MFGDKVKTMRCLVGWTQRELGAMCGLSASAIGMIEQGRRLPSPRRYARMREAFRLEGCSLPDKPNVPTLRHDLLELLREEPTAPAWKPAAAHPSSAPNKKGAT